jgi:S-adenosylmethionine:tRNA ribosyltransferase-isomerase
MNQPPDPFSLSSYDYSLPLELIAQVPAAARDESRLMVVRRRGGRLEHRRFRQIVDCLPADSVLVLNDTKVIPARLYGRKPSGGRLEILLLHPLAEGAWEAMLKGRVKAGTAFTVGEGLTGRVLGLRSPGRWEVGFEYAGDFSRLLSRFGHPPLPPYIKRSPGQDDSRDRQRYQTVYARVAGAVAAPTAGLHFTGELLEELRQRGVEIVYLTLHVGPGTFLPLKERDIRRHRMESEYYSIPPATAAAVNRAHAESRRVAVVGTSTLRALESAKDKAGAIEAKSGRTELFIGPGYTFCSTYALLTNLHLPRSTNLVLVSAFAGYELTMQAYREAVSRGYRFYSYGDAMLIV